MTEHTTQSELLRGIKDCTPIMIGIIPFGLILGAQTAQKDMSVLGATDNSFRG